MGKRSCDARASVAAHEFADLADLACKKSDAGARADVKI